MTAAPTAPMLYDRIVESLRCEGSPICSLTVCMAAFDRGYRGEMASGILRCHQNLALIKGRRQQGYEGGRLLLSLPGMPAAMDMIIDRLGRRGIYPTELHVRRLMLDGRMTPEHAARVAEAVKIRFEETPE